MADPSPAPPPAVCLLCGHAALVEIKCKMICRHCGYTRDCSDP